MNEEKKYSILFKNNATSTISEEIAKALIADMQKKGKIFAQYNNTDGIPFLVINMQEIVVISLVENFKSP